MRILANANFPRAAVDALRNAGLDVLWAQVDLIGESDRVVLQRAQTDKRVLLTFDKDFGELAFRSGLPADCGIVLFRISVPSPEAVAVRTVTENIGAIRLARAFCRHRSPTSPASRRALAQIHPLIFITYSVRRFA